MSQCLNPDCLQQNPPKTIFCQRCGSKLVLQERYRGVRVIGEGGFGRTFLAVDEQRLDTPCVIKQFLPQQSGSGALEKATELFKQEAFRLRDLGKHSHIPDLLAFFPQEGRLYLIQEFIEGKNLLDELQQKGKFSESEVKQILVELLPILQFVHDNKVIHRDIKPENIIRSSQTGALFLIDFGVSKEVGGSVLTRVGTITGTPGYAPPEQMRGKVFPNSDLYSLAVTCIRLLTGCFQKDDGDDLIFDSMRMQWIWKQYVSVSQELEIVLDKMLQDLPIDRFQSATEVLSGLEKQIVSTSSKLPVSSKPVQTGLPKINYPKIPTSFIENLGNYVFLEMLKISGGKFIMGSPDGEGDDSEKPQHQVTVPPFFMGKYPVTQAQWERIAALPKVKIDLKSQPSHFKGANLPVENVSWHDAQEFCARISKHTGKIYRLPSEAEWEYACRAKTTTPYYFGENITFDLANYSKFLFGKTTDLGKFPPNNFGLYDMHGNVWEWCEDGWHENYINAPIWPNDSIPWISSNDVYVMRGGSWCSDDKICRSAYRHYSNPYDRCYDYGFRLVVSGVGTL
ncbi:SUMF1/EgtB/PvdO family nonheme iron enzyme [Aphanizomenon flos-aquae NRERC-008]|uniref:SUMF1/EgtB/PvdO family nonheme iron enzyme n=1 Tax=Aphanizomenon flos-aquae FACHB-1249 TaxID=2692889 RepID=A0ABR8IXH5_APHFL|nr:MULTISPECIES: SUMF1/EgtB/PvdO family nonheme iron enzyme [Aphanizomenon]MBD2392374.1 SUMF1/EgtB/PvdO family nonheme iron enzyme [Aphanizomenon flos-aquae FACHB-1171]MBD2558746.1 SUMF1/EgtB/PvdO family nonheme iron enzyme [Aphanizomenon flos-aquae FACHB-1290]MBD2633082.1 SUMF1/EgtB/PvdO family nonheme iron enzyme [Aphanizomenon sp. FACHB-1399]MBD2643954.1 SUMF1/EgtB/PvdO family nonheme iron enzyme [Aphanizomenon sp. FACHB-1401]MBD2659073.1 SUMF1/EgtB/PvdO family nonheme iron enzyme [Aphanizo